MRPCTTVEVIGPPSHRAVVVRALEQEGVVGRWLQPPHGRDGDEHDLTLVVHATGSERLVVGVIAQLRSMHPRLRVTIEGPC